eukprot:augustus_masked-scaffold_5-processed-gene-1.13-mRNA-1 protein AED:0.10 eAED:0.10 QI:0/-1/0/1/-1/1/1/0/178
MKNIFRLSKPLFNQKALSCSTLSRCNLLQSSYAVALDNFYPRSFSTISEEKPRKRTRRTLRPKKDPITLTDNATDRIKFLLRNKPEVLGVRLGVKRRGCNGLSYTLNYAEEAGKFEDKVEKNGVTVFVEPKAIMHLVGTVMDYYEDDLSAEFRFENPNAEGQCGCGESFNTKPAAASG